ncbi:hexosaminidase D-like isoform X2 [Cimex lectularius]|nr:hexosaminidase D-like isoform X2 [Cimex lectularius]XP_014250390.1 hexosaminidase D-like isoform X2 [Cimex lectularius]XP_014250392.1 hexosaminidase D-like isoform X2 [Cimex lectularius]XP_014250393.1 hexosaminidase D-like isoform X2 [Cimex lectularius]
MKIAGHYAGWVTLTVWRKKTSLLVLVLAVILVVACFQYNSAKEVPEKEDEVAKVGSMQDKRSLLGGSSVQFVFNVPSQTVPSPAKSFISYNDESMLRDDIKKNEVSDMALNEMSSFSKTPYVPAKRLLHLDLKGAPPKVSYLKKVIQLAKDSGATGILLEWEDMFPWTGPLANIAAGNAYSKNDIKEILTFSMESDLEVIPLIQTFGHVEFALKHEEFAHLREVPESAQALCPSLNASLDFVQLLIDQVMELHPHSKYLHIGCDEVFQMGECSRCRNQQRENLFLNHVARVAGIVRSKYRNVTPIIWDDMLRHLTPNSLEQYRIGELVEPMVWVYAEDVYRFVSYSVWDKYAAIFPRVWAASAFKGAFGETLYIPNVKRHLENNLRWLDVMSNEGPKFKHGFQGIAITGWQRYDHFSVLCELLPAAIPSLTVTLVATTYGYMNSSLRAKLNSFLNCGILGPSSYFNLNTDPFLWDSYSRCAFPGNAFFKLTYRLNNAEKEADELISMIRKQKGWMTDYNVRHNFSTSLRIDELMQDHPRIQHSMISLAKSAKDALVDVFDIHTIAEWIEQKIYPYVSELDQIEKDANALRARKVWPRRPFPLLNDLYNRLGIQGDEENEVIPPG